MLGVNERMVFEFKLFGREIIFEEFQPTVFDHGSRNHGTCMIVIDRQTDGRTDGRTDDMQSHNRTLR